MNALYILDKHCIKHVKYKACFCSLPEIHSLSHAVVNRYGHTLERNSDGGGPGSMIASVIGRHPLRQTIVGFGCGWSVCIVLLCIIHSLRF